MTSDWCSRTDAGVKVHCAKIDVAEQPSKYKDEFLDMMANVPGECIIDVDVAHVKGAHNYSFVQLLSHIECIQASAFAEHNNHISAVRVFPMVGMAWAIQLSLRAIMTADHYAKVTCLNENPQK